MTKSKDYVIVNDSMFNSRGSAFFIPNSKVKHYYYLYNCSNYGSKYTLKELAEKKKIVWECNYGNKINENGSYSKK